jgi:transmembrane sensor
MNNIVEFSTGDGEYGEAVDWLLKVEHGLTEIEQRELRGWFDKDQKNLEKFLEAAEMWDKMGVLSRLSDLFPKPAAVQRVRRSRFAAAMIVAVFLAPILWGAQSIFHNAEPEEVTLTADANWPSHATYETVVGEQSTARLPDGSEIVLNTNSLLEVRYTQHQRVLRLLRGEMHVTVVPDINRPLSVVAGDNIVQAVGTAFSVEIGDDAQVEVAVTQGKVRVALRAKNHKSGDVVSTPVLPASSITLGPGEVIQLGRPNVAVEIVSPEELAVRLSWREGNIIFRGETLAEAIAEIARYTTVEFVFLNESIKGIEVAGRFKAGDVDGLLAVLHENAGVAYERTDDGRVLLSQM